MNISPIKSQVIRITGYFGYDSVQSARPLNSEYRWECNGYAFYTESRKAKREGQESQCHSYGGRGGGKVRRQQNILGLFLHILFKGPNTVVTCTAKTKCQKFETNIPRKGISGSQSQFPHSCVCERIMYIFPRWVCLFCWKKYVDR